MDLAGSTGGARDVSWDGLDWISAGDCPDGSKYRAPIWC